MNHDTGFVIPKNLNTVELMAYLTDLLPVAMRYIRAVCGATRNTAYNLLTDDPSEEYFSPLVLCLKTLRSYQTYPGKAGNFPTGELIWNKCLSKGKGDWTENWIVFCMFISLLFFSHPISYTFTIVGVRDAAKIHPVAEKWLIGQEPLAPIPCISGSESGEEDSDSSASGADSASEYGSKGSRSKLVRSGSETDVQRIVKKKGRLFALSPDGGDDSSDDDEDESTGSQMTRKTRCKTLLVIFFYMI